MYDVEGPVKLPWLQEPLLRAWEVYHEPDVTQLVLCNNINGYAS